MNEMDRDLDILIGTIETHFKKSKFNLNDSGPEFDEFLDDIAISLSVGPETELFNELDDALIAAIDHFESGFGDPDENEVYLKILRPALDYCDPDEDE